MWYSRRRQRFKSYINAPITQHLLGWSLVAILGLIVNGIGFFYWGYDYGLQRIGATATEVHQIKQQVSIQAQRISSLEMQLTQAQQNADIAQQVIQKLQQENKNQLASVADMQEQIMVYQRLLGTKASSSPLNIDSVKILKTAQGSYQYRVLLIQNQANQARIAVKLNLRIIGTSKGKSIELELQQLELQYFKSVTGEFVLPQSFVAESIEITAQVLGKKAAKVQKNFKWDVET